jgi:membrane fusion protein (multidrug efflux system)
MKRYVWASSFLLAAVIGCGRSQPSRPPQATTAAPVETVAVVSKKLKTTQQLPGQLLAYESVDIFPKVTGFVEEVRVDVGSRVKKGELLARLSAPELASQRAQAEAALHAAESQLASAEAKLKADEGTRERLEAASKTPGVVAENDVMVAAQAAAAGRGGVAAAESQVKAARDALRAVSQTESYLKIAAPFSGVVSRRELHPGALVGPASGQSGAQPILQIVDTDRLRLVVPVPEADVGAMALGTQVAFVVPAYLGETFSAPIARISHDVNVQTRTMHVELDVENQNGRLSPGSFATVTWPIERGYPTLFVPTSAVASDQQRTFVIRVAGGVAEWVTVQTGQSLKGEIEVVGTLQAGDQVVKSATDSIRNGQKVNPT